MVAILWFVGLAIAFALLTAVVYGWPCESNWPDGN